MNKQLARFEFKPQRIEGISPSPTEDTMELTFELDTFRFVSLHDRDCCERVYADFSIIGYYREQLFGSYGNKYSAIVIWGVEDMGFIIEFVGSYFPNKALIPCYNEQNGYYSDELVISITKNSEPPVIVELEGYKQDLVG